MGGACPACKRPIDPFKKVLITPAGQMYHYACGVRYASVNKRPRITTHTLTEYEEVGPGRWRRR